MRYFNEGAAEEGSSGRNTTSAAVAQLTNSSGTVRELMTEVITRRRDWDRALITPGHPGAHRLLGRSIGRLASLQGPFAPLTPPATLSVATPAATAQPTAASFTYGVTVKDDTTNQPIANAKVRIEVAGKAPLDEYADSNGFARLFIPAALAERPGRLTVEADGYAIDVRNIDLWPDRLPAEVRLKQE